jgi:ribosomal protein S27AE
MDMSVLINGLNKAKDEGENEVKIRDLNATCSQCGEDIDLLTAFTEHKICGKCTRKNHKQVTK